MATSPTEKFYEKLNYEKAPLISVNPPGPKASVLLERQKKVDSNVLAYPKVVPLAPVRGLGATVIDADGNCFIDFNSGVGVLNVGHSNPDIVAAVKAQIEEMTHCLDFPAPPRVEMSEKLVALAPGEMRNKCRVFLCGPTGSEAVEAAVKLGKYHSKKSGIISFEGGWHGVSGIGLAATGKRGIREGFLPVMPEVTIIPYAYCYRCAFGMTYPDCNLQCAKYFEHIVRDPDSGATNPGCVLIESIQGEGGIVIPPDGYLQEVRRVCTKYGLVMIVDEIQTGFGRSGAMFACENWGITPDIMTVSKTLGGGLPLAAVVIKEEFDTWTSGAHVGTFRGNLLSCAAGLAALNFIDKNHLVERSRELGKKALERAKEIGNRSRFIGDVRGKGLFIGLEFVKDKNTKEPAPDILQEVTKKCFERGLFMFKGGRWNNVARIMPPFVITEALLNQGISILGEVLNSMEK